jgi:hypothetical protein
MMKPAVLLLVLASSVYLKLQLAGYRSDMGVTKDDIKMDPTDHNVVIQKMFAVSRFREPKRHHHCCMHRHPSKKLQA